MHEKEWTERGEPSLAKTSRSFQPSRMGEGRAKVTCTPLFSPFSLYSQKYKHVKNRYYSALPS